MKKKNTIFVTLLLSILMVASTFGVATIHTQNNKLVNEPQATGTTSFDISVEKTVWDGCNWAEEVFAKSCTIVRFNITVENTGQCVIYNISVVDTLSDSLEYENNATVNGTAMEPSINGKKLTWIFPDEIQPSEKIYIEFDAHVIGEPCSVDINHVEVTATTYEDNTVSDEDEAKVIIPGMCCQKKVWDPVAEEWVEEINAFYGDIVTFKITLVYYGQFNLYNIKVRDMLPANLEYANNADPEETAVSADKKTVWWNLSTELEHKEEITITFDAKVVDYGECINLVNITANECSGETWYCEDTASVITKEGMIVEKQVWDPATQTWVEEINASVGETVRFKITVTYHGGYTLYNIKIRDDLPECLEYADNADPEETAVSADLKTVWWNLSVELSDGESTSVEFDALITETSGCGPCINVANITANECSGAILHKEDTAVVDAACPLNVNAGGPYFAEIGETISLGATASGGIPPYSYAWDLDDDGSYDDATGASTSHAWNTAGTHLISVRVTDNNGQTGTDETTVNIENTAPDAPTVTGTASGTINQEYTYEAQTTDPEGDDVYYWFDWGDGTNSGWVGPKDSGVIGTATHTWTQQGDYTIKVKSKDEHGAESGWTELPITMPKAKTHRSNIMKTSSLQKISIQSVATKTLSQH